MHAQTREDDARRTMERSHSSWMLARFWHFVIMGERVRANADNICICLSLECLLVSTTGPYIWTIYLHTLLVKGYLSVVHLSICSHLYLYIFRISIYISIFIYI